MIYLLTKEKIEEMLYIDKMTNLPNRNSLIKAIKENSYEALILINIDNFKI